MILVKSIIMLVVLVFTAPFFLLGFVLNFVFSAFMSGVHATKDFDRWLINED